MDINITQTETKVIKGTLGKPRFSMSPDNKGKYTASIRFPIIDAEQKIAPIPTFNDVTVNIPIEEWNNFWSNFNTGGYFFQLLKSKYDISALVIPTDIETWFIN